MKILVCGGKGQLGGDCVRILNAKHEVVSVDIDELDITQPDAVEKTVRAVKPELLLNCAGHTGVDACESEADLAHRINAWGPELLAKQMDQIGGAIIHISTDYVFDGLKPVPEPYIETDPASPLSQYGKTKLEGEKAVSKFARRHMIVRTAWLYGIGGKNFLKTMLALALNPSDKPIRIVNDQFGSPTWSHGLARQIEHLIKAGGQGIYHASSEGYCTWYELAEAFLAQLGISHSLMPCTTAEYPTPAARPVNSILENSRLKASGLHIMGHWQEDLKQFIKQHRDDLLEEAKKKLKSQVLK